MQPREPDSHVRSAAAHLGWLLVIVIVLAARVRVHGAAIPHVQILGVRVWGDCCGGDGGDDEEVQPGGRADGSAEV